MQGLKIAVHQLRYDYDPSKRQVIFLFTDGGVEFDDESEAAAWEKEYAQTVAEAKALKAEVIIVGLGNRCEIWDPARYDEFLIKDQQSFSKLAQKFLSVETPPLAGLAA